MIVFVDNTQNPVTHEHKKAIVTIIIGDDYRRTWLMLCRENWERYGREFGYDLIIITDHLDASERARSRSPAWQKLLILNQKWSAHYDRIVWVDSDIIISQSACDIVSCVPNGENIGIADSQLSNWEKDVYWERYFKVRTNPATRALQDLLDQMSADDSKCFGITAKEGPEYNTGVLVLSPERHRGLLLDVYNNYEQTGPRYEQLPLSHAVNCSGKLKLITARFNWNVHHAMRLGHLHQGRDGELVRPEEIIVFLRNELSKSYFLHFAGAMPMLKMLSDWREQANVIL
jgi:hypothetical protein